MPELLSALTTCAVTMCGKVSIVTLGVDTHITEGLIYD